MISLKVVISGSFRKHLQGILKLKKELEERGIEVIKPKMKIKKFLCNFEQIITNGDFQAEQWN